MGLLQNLQSSSLAYKVYLKSALLHHCMCFHRYRERNSGTNDFVSLEIGTCTNSITTRSKKKKRERIRILSVRIIFWKKNKFWCSTSPPCAVAHKLSHTWLLFENDRPNPCINRATTTIKNYYEMNDPITGMITPKMKQGPKFERTVLLEHNCHLTYTF